MKENVLMAYYLLTMIFSIIKQWYLIVYRNTCTHKQVLLKLIDPIVSCKTQPFLMIHISNQNWSFIKYEFVFCKNNSVKNAFLKDQY